MHTLYLILYIAAAVCFLVAALVQDPRRNRLPVNLVALGLLFLVLVPLIVQARLV